MASGLVDKQPKSFSSRNPNVRRFLLPRRDTEDWTKSRKIVEIYGRYSRLKSHVVISPTHTRPTRTQFHLNLFFVLGDGSARLHGQGQRGAAAAMRERTKMADAR